jgi:hypothetical protein
MKKIKQQIDSIISFKANSLEKLTEEYDSIRERIQEGIEKMQNSKIFTNEEIKEINTYAKTMLNQKYTNARTDLTKTLKDNFVF